MQAVRLRIQTDQSTVGTEPDTVLPIFYRLVGYIVREAVRLRIVGGKPEKTLAVFRNSGHFVGADGSAVSFYMQIVHRFVRLRLIAEDSVAHSRHPYIPFFVFKNIAHKGIAELFHFFKCPSPVGRTEDIPAISQPDCSLTVTMQGVDGSFADTHLFRTHCLYTSFESNAAGKGGYGRCNQVDSSFKVACTDQIVRGE